MKTRTSFIAKDTRFTVEETPIEIGTIECEFEVECSVQEMAQGGSTLMNVMKFVKDSIKEAQASAQQYTPTPVITTAKNKVETPKVEQRWDLPSVWDVMMKKLPEGFKKSGIGCYAFETGTIKDKNKITVKIEFNEDSIDMDIYVGSTAIHGYLYSEGERSRVSGINPVLMQDMIEEMPEEIKEFVKDYFDKVNK